MATIVNNPSGSDEGMGAGMILGIVVGIVLVLFLIVYALPGLRNTQTPVDTSRPTLEVNLPGTGGSNNSGSGNSGANQ